MIMGSRSSQIREAVELLDQKLDAQPRDKRTWLRLANALAMGYAPRARPSRRSTRAATRKRSIPPTATWPG